MLSESSLIQVSLVLLRKQRARRFLHTLILSVEEKKTCRESQKAAEREGF